MPTLAQRPCIPCRGGVEPLTREQCAGYLPWRWEAEPDADNVPTPTTEQAKKELLENLRR